MYWGLFLESRRSSQPAVPAKVKFRGLQAGVALTALGEASRLQRMRRALISKGFGLACGLAVFCLLTAATPAHEVTPAAEKPKAPVGKAESAAQPGSRTVAQSAPTPALSIGQNASPAELPFWRLKPELMRRMREDRAIVVSVRHSNIVSDQSEKQIRFTIQGAGVVGREKDTAFRIAKQFEKLKLVSGHFKEVKVDPTGREVFMVISALGYQARMTLAMTPVAADWRSEMQWEVVSGSFQGMKGVVGYERMDATHTEMSIQTRYEAAKLPLPKALMGFALEVVTQQVAQKMRSFIEAGVDPQPPAESSK